MQEITNSLNQKERVPLSNPYFEALPIINSIRNSNRGLNLKTDQIKVPEVNLSTGELGVENVLPNAFVPTSGNAIIPSSPISQINTSEQYASLFPNDVIGQAIANRPKQIVG